jgi:hypothetical protein
MALAAPFPNSWLWRCRKNRRADIHYKQRRIAENSKTNGRFGRCANCR